jgi:hypothetical protein
MFELKNIRRSSAMSEIKEPLLNQDQLTDEPLFKGLDDFQKKGATAETDEQQEETIIYIDGTVYPPKNVSNRINN